MREDDFQISFYVVTLLFLSFVAGLLAFLYFKFYSKLGRSHLKDFSTREIAYFPILPALLVTGFMLLGSAAGLIIIPAFGFSERFDFADLIPFAIHFFVEAYVVLAWLAIASRKQFASKGRARLTTAAGLFVIFSAMNVLAVFFWDLGLLIELFSSTLLFELIVQIPLSMLDSAQGLVRILSDPWAYILYSLESSGGNQFVLVSHYPIWALAFLVFGGIYAVLKGEFQA